MIPYVAIVCTQPGHLVVGAIKDHGLSEAVPLDHFALCPGEHRLSSVVLLPEVHCHIVLVLQWTEPHRLPAIVDNHRAVVARPPLWGDEDVAWGSVVRPSSYLEDGRSEVWA